MIATPDSVIHERCRRCTTDSPTAVARKTARQAISRVSEKDWLMVARQRGVATFAALEAELADLRGRVSVPSDRDALLYLMERFDSEESNCPVCGHSEATSNMDSANYLREYLAAATAPKFSKIEPSDDRRPSIRRRACLRLRS